MIQIPLKYVLYPLLLLVVYVVYFLYNINRDSGGMYTDNDSSEDIEIARRKFGGIKSFQTNVSDLGEKQKKKC